MWILILLYTATVTVFSQKCSHQIDILDASSLSPILAALLADKSKVPTAEACAKECYTKQCDVAYFDKATGTCQFSSNSVATAASKCQKTLNARRIPKEANEVDDLVQRFCIECNAATNKFSSAKRPQLRDTSRLNRNKPVPRLPGSSRRIRPLLVNSGLSREEYRESSKISYAPYTRINRVAGFQGKSSQKMVAGDTVSSWRRPAPLSSTFQYQRSLRANKIQQRDLTRLAIHTEQQPQRDLSRVSSNRIQQRDLSRLRFHRMANTVHHRAKLPLSRATRVQGRQPLLHRQPTFVPPSYKTRPLQQLQVTAAGQAHSSRVQGWQGREGLPRTMDMNTTEQRAERRTRHRSRFFSVQDRSVVIGETERYDTKRHRSYGIA